MLLPVVFIAGAVWHTIAVILVPGLLGSHATFYTEAARAWLTGGNPWAIGRPGFYYGGPPTMLLPLAPFVFLPDPVTRAVWVLGDLLVAAMVLRRLRLPAWWLAFPPLVSAIEIGHPEVLVLGLLMLISPVAGLAAVIKPYAALPLLAERNWRALALAAVVVLLTAPLLPWTTFVASAPHVAQALVEQSAGDSVFGQPVLEVIALACVLPLGARRFLWLATPVLWPAAQPIYKIPSIPMMAPIVALAWAIPVSGMTLIGLVAFAVVAFVARRRPIPAWLASGIATPIPDAPVPPRAKPARGRLGGAPSVSAS